MTSQTENFYSVLSKVFTGFGQTNGRQGRPRRQAVVTRNVIEASAFSGDCVTWSAGLFQAISDDLCAAWRI
jgi:hypothetical protein